MPKKAAETKAPAAAVAKPAPAEKKPAPAAAKAPAGDKPAPQATKAGDGAAKKHDGGAGGARKYDGPKKEGQGSNSNGYQGKSDPEIDRLNANIEAIKSEIRACQEQVSSIDKKIESKKGDKDTINTDRSGVQAKLAELKISITNANNAKQADREKADEIDRLREIKIKESQKLRNAFPGRAPAVDAPDSYLKKIDDDIKEKERAHASKSYTLPEEKQFLAEMSALQQAKKQFKEYKALQTDIAADKEKKQALYDKSKEHNVALKALYEQRDALQKDNSSVGQKIKDSRSEVDDLYQQRAQAKERIVQLRADQDAEWDKIRVVRDQRKQQYEKKKAEQAVVKKQYDDRKREKIEAARKLEDAKEPYEDELWTCDHVIGYLQTFVKKEEKPADAAAADTASPAAPARSNAPEGTVLKREKEEEGPLKSKKQAKKKALSGSDNINHDISVFGYFETISLSPPAKVADVEASIGQIQAKKEHFKKLAEVQVEARRVKREKEAKEQEEKQKADAEAEAAAAAASTTTTTTTTSSAAPSEEVAAA